MKKAFTIIELVVVIGVMGIIMAAVVGILINSFRAKTRVELADVTGQVGGQVINELKNNIFSSLGTGVTCAIDAMSPGDSISFVNGNDGEVTTLTCVEGSKIASESANGSFDLTTSGVTVTGCNDFARCVEYPGATNKISTVNFSFKLSTGSSGAGAEKFVERVFKSTVVVRN